MKFVFLITTLNILSVIKISPTKIETIIVGYNKAPAPKSESQCIEANTIQSVTISSIETNTFLCLLSNVKVYILFA